MLTKGTQTLKEGFGKGSLHLCTFVWFILECVRLL